MHLERREKVLQNYSANAVHMYIINYSVEFINNYLYCKKKFSNLSEEFHLFFMFPGGVVLAI